MLRRGLTSQVPVTLDVQYICLGSTGFLDLDGENSCLIVYNILCIGQYRALISLILSS
jgi:hypothetical protein